jgi:hypothetical protein
MTPRPCFRHWPLRLWGVAAAAVLVGAGTVATAPPANAVATNQRTVIVHMVPQLQGVAFTFDNQPYVSGPGGIATVNTDNLVDAASRLALTTQKIYPTIQVSLDRVTSNPAHGVFTRNLVVELDEARLVTIQLETPKALVLSSGAVSSVTLNDTLGRTITFSGKQLRSPVWLASSEPARVAGGVGGRVVTYSVKSVIMRGSNVVNSGQQHFTANSSTTWQIPVILYSLTIEANELLAGKPAGSSAQLTFPDHSKEVIPLGRAHRIVLTNLPRGSYQVKIKGSLVPLGSTVQLSRNQTATELVVTPGDAAEIVIMVIILLGVVVAAGVVGRRLRRIKDERADADGDGDADGAGPLAQAPVDPDGAEASLGSDQDREGSDHALSV